MIDNIERMLRINRIHGDLSPFNVLYFDGRVTIIDFPQSIDPRENREAYELLRRDVTNICDHFAKFGVRSDGHRIASGLWSRYLRAEL
jgi:RIO kinase 1